MSQQSYLITKQKLDENEITSKRENKIQSSITSKSNTEGEIKKNQFFLKKSDSSYHAKFAARS
jgi:hypothetical protein